MTTLTTKLPMTPRAKRAVKLAEEEARRLGNSYIGTHHVLLGLILEDGIAAGILDRRGVTLEQVRAAVAAVNEPKGADAA